MRKIGFDETVSKLFNPKTLPRIFRIFRPYQVQGKLRIHPRSENGCYQTKFLKEDADWQKMKYYKLPSPNGFFDPGYIDSWVIEGGDIYLDYLRETKFKIALASLGELNLRIPVKDGRGRKIPSAREYIKKIAHFLHDGLQHKFNCKITIQARGSYIYSSGSRASGLFKVFYITEKEQKINMIDEVLSAGAFIRSRECFDIGLKDYDYFDGRLKNYYIPLGNIELFEIRVEREKRRR